MKTIKLIPAWLIQGTDLIEGKGFELAKVSANHSNSAQRFITLDDGESWIKEESWTNAIRFNLEDAQSLLERDKKDKIEYYEKEIQNVRKQLIRLGKHPELLDGEVFIINTDDVEYKQFLENKPDHIKSYRLGEVAYTNDGTVIPHKRFKPLFATLK